MEFCCFCQLCKNDFVWGNWTCMSSALQLCHIRMQPHLIFIRIRYISYPVKAAESQCSGKQVVYFKRELRLTTKWNCPQIFQKVDLKTVYVTKAHNCLEHFRCEVCTCFGILMCFGHLHVFLDIHKFWILHMFQDLHVFWIFGCVL